MKKNIILALAALTMLACAEKNTPDAGHGNFNNIKWNFKNGILTISGTGDMEQDQITFSWPWSDYRKKITQVIIEEGITSIGYYAFSGCTNLTSVTIPSSVTSIGEEAFYDCNSLPVFDNLRYADTYLVGTSDRLQSAYTIKDGTKWIGNDAFNHCICLTSIQIPNTIISIGKAAFRYCIVLDSINIPNSVARIENEVFEDCYSLTSVTIPNSVTSIGSNAFCGCINLTSIEIPNSVITIGGSVFGNCVSLTSPVYNDHVFAFMPISYTGAYSISNGIEYIAGGAFASCKVLTSIEIPNSVVSIGDFAFSGCIGLTSVTCLAINPPILEESMFQFEGGMDRSTIPLYVPNQSVEAYKSAYIWKDFNPIVGI